jgi:hypothetical protein
MNLREKTTVAVGHIDDPASMDALCKILAAIHGPEYILSVVRWRGQTTLTAPRGRQRFCFVMEEEKVRVLLAPGQRVRGVPASGPYQRLEEHWGEVIAPVEEELWPGDVLCINGNQRQPIIVTGNVTCFQVETEATAYPLPTVAFLRHLNDRPGGCAAYPGAFRREALPPVRAAAGAEDQRGVNRVNEHTLDMRSDRTPRPQPHHHGPVAIGAGARVNHSETALVLPRARYNLPFVDEPETGRVVIYPQATTDPADTMVVPVRPGSVVVTPATSDGIVGHCFENAFAMLVAIPGFVSPHCSIKGSIGGSH